MDSLKRSPIFSGVLSLPESYLYRSPIFTGVLSLQESYLYRSPIFSGVLSLQESYLYRSPIFTGVLSFQESYLYRSPIFTGALSLQESYLYRSPIFTGVLSLQESYLYRSSIFTGVLSLQESYLYRSPIFTGVLSLQESYLYRSLIFTGVTTHEGQFFVSDTGNDRVQVFDQDGNFVRCIGEGKLHSPRGIAVSGDLIYIANSGMGNISVFERRTGQLVDKLHNTSPHSCDLQLPTGVTTDSNGYIFFTDANNFFCNHFIQVLTREHRYSHSIGVVGNKPGEFLGPSDLTTDSLGNVIITDTRNHRIQIVDKNNSLVACFGGFGRKKGLLHFPYGVCELEGVLYVSDTNNHRIQVFNSQTS
ncbi:hypothetical protein ACHWQZ_G006689 [Mnemiopsis leidyi]